MIKSNEEFDMVVIFKDLEDYHDDDVLIGIEEIKLLLEDIAPYFYIKESEYLDVVLVELGSDSIETVKKISGCPTQIISRIIPVQAVVRTDLTSITLKIKELAVEKMKRGNTFIMDCDLRDIEKLDFKVILQATIEILSELNIYYDEIKPDYVIQMECIGENTGLGIIRYSEISP